MKTPLMLAIAGLCLASPAAAAEKALCDAKPFTLGKPAQAKPAEPVAKKAPPAPVKVAAAPAKPKPLADCDKPKGKRRS